MNKKSFILYCDNSAYLDTLTDAQSGQLFRAVFAYQCEREYEIPCTVVAALFSVLRVQFERDSAKYEKIVEKRREVIDPCCGSRMMWFNRSHENAIYGDIRECDLTLCDGRQPVVSPDVMHDFRCLPYADCSFNLVVFDPPHLKNVGSNSWLAAKYGMLTTTWREDIAEGFSECYRVLSCGGTLIFKWNETQIKLSDILALFPVKPLFGHTTTTNCKTHWCVFYKPESNIKLDNPTIP